MKLQCDVAEILAPVGQAGAWKLHTVEVSYTGGMDATRRKAEDLCRQQCESRGLQYTTIAVRRLDQPKITGYTVVPDLLTSLRAELDAHCLQHCVVPSPDAPIPLETLAVCVLRGPSPEGWRRYSKCRDCGGAVGLNQHGYPKTEVRCPQCTQIRHASNTDSRLWTILESATRPRELQLGFDVAESSIAALRAAVQAGSAFGIGPEREGAVTEALDAWRRQTLRSLSESISAD